MDIDKDFTMPTSGETIYSQLLFLFTLESPVPPFYIMLKLFQSFFLSYKIP